LLFVNAALEEILALSAIEAHLDSITSI